MNLVFHISEDGSEIELKHYTSNTVYFESNRRDTHEIIHKVECYLFIPLVILLVKVKRI